MRTRTAGGSGAREELGGRPDAVDPRHAEVHQHDVGTVLGDRGGHLVAVGGLPDDRDVVGLAEHQRAARSGRGRRRRRGARGPGSGRSSRLHAGQGTRTATRKRSWSGPRASTRPPARSTRSVMPSSPFPAPDGAGRPGQRVADLELGVAARGTAQHDLDGLARGVAGGVGERLLRDAVERAAALVGQRAPSASSSCSRHRCARGAHAVEEAVEVGEGRLRRPAGRDRPRRRPRRRCPGRAGRPRIARRSTSASRAPARMTSSASRISSGEAVRRWASAPACSETIDRRWARTSCISRAIRVRSAVRAASARSAASVSARSARSTSESSSSWRARTAAPEATTAAVITTAYPRVAQDAASSDCARTGPARGPIASERAASATAVGHGRRTAREKVATAPASQADVHSTVSAETTSARADRVPAAREQQRRPTGRRRPGRPTTTPAPRRPGPAGRSTARARPPAGRRRARRRRSRRATSAVGGTAVTLAPPSDTPPRPKVDRGRSLRR